MYLKVESVWKTGSDKRISNYLMIAYPGNSNELCHHCQFQWSLQQSTDGISE